MKRSTRLFVGLAAAGLALSTLLSATAANTAAVACTAAVDNIKTDAVSNLLDIQRSDERMQEMTVSQAIDEMLSSGNYSEGEAIAVVRGSAGPAVSERTELLMYSGADAVMGAIETETKNSSPAADLARQRMEEEDNDYSIWLVSDPGKSAKELLQELYAEPDVISAEPNYVTYAAEEPVSEEAPAAEEPEAEAPAGAEVPAPAEPGAAESGAEVPAPAEPGAAEPTAEATAPAEPGAAELAAVSQKEPLIPGDLTDMQWYLADTSDSYTTPLSPTGGYNLNVPGWMEGRRDENAPANASGTICIMDTGIDTDHPDLQGVLYEFTAEQQAKYGCGQYGFNASGDDRPLTEQKAVGTHGTHVAGIIAADWDGDGVSGVAHGVKIFSVNVFGGTGTVMEMKSVLQGFRFLTDVAQEVNLKAVNCSWGTAQPQFALSTAIEELGRKGVNVVIASGNRYLDLDETIDLGSMNHSEFAIVVNSASADGSMTDFSCWGQDSTDVFAPGGSILSSIPEIVQVGEASKPDVYEDNRQFYPEASVETSLLSQIERFDSDKPGVLFFDANPAIEPEARQIGEIDDRNGYDDKRSMSLRLSALPKEEPSSYGVYRAVNGYAYMAIPVTSARDARRISVKTAMSDAFKPVGAIDSITCRDAGGNPIELDSACAAGLRKGLGSSSSYTFYQCQWAVLTYDIQAYMEASNEAHELLAQEMDEEKRNELLYTGLGDYRDPGEIEGIYEWEHDGVSYVIARIGIGVLAGDARQTEVTEETALLVDNVAVGGEGAYTGGYSIYSGTSMAAPTVTGCLAVIAANEPENASMTDEQLETAARERAAKLLACVDYDEELAALCRTGGRVNLHGKTEFTVKAPLILGTEVSREDRSLTVRGWYFGTQGSIAVDDREIEALSWEDGAVRADVSGLSNGSHVVRVTNADGAVSRAVFNLSSESAQGRGLFERSHALPVHEQAFLENDCDRIYDSIAACDGRIYAFAVSAKYRMPQGLWSYDLQADRWSPCPLPEGLDLNSSYGANQFAVLKDRLYLFGRTLVQISEDESQEEQHLWQYDPAGNRWEQMKVELPSSCAGICVLGDTLYAVDGRYWLNEEDEAAGAGTSGSAAEDEVAAAVEEAAGTGETAAPDETAAMAEESAMSGETAAAAGEPAGTGETAASAEESADECMKFFKIDPSESRGIEVSSDIDPYLDGTYAKITASSDKIYIYMQYGFDAEVTADRDLTAKGKLIRASYDEAQDRFVTEDLTDLLEEALGPDLRTEHDKQNAGDEPAEHFAIAGIENGLAIIGSGTPGEDVHIIYDDGNEVVLYDRASSYHKAFDPIAVCYDGRLYVIGYNTTEPDVMYFRSDPVRDMTESKADPEGSGAAALAGVTSDTAAEEGNTATASEANLPAAQPGTAGFSRYSGAATIALIAGVVVFLTVMRRKK